MTPSPTALVAAARARGLPAGSSLGGEIAWQLAARRPEQVGRLVLVDPAGYPVAGHLNVFDLGRVPGLRHLVAQLTPRFLVAVGLREAYGDPSRVTDELVDRYYGLLRRPGNRQALLDSLAVEDTSDPEVIRTVSQPALVMRGREDRLISVELAERFHRDLPCSRMIVYGGIGHVPMEEIPARSAADARDFLLATDAGC